MARLNLARAPIPKPPAIGIGKLLRRAHMAFSREFRDRLARHGVTFGEFVHLDRLWDEDGLMQTELSNRVGIATASSTQIIDTLEKRGFIRRKRNQRDRRQINVFLTQTGRHLKRPLLNCARETNRIARSGLMVAEILSLFASVEKIVKNLEAVPYKDHSNVRQRRQTEAATQMRSHARQYPA